MGKKSKDGRTTSEKVSKEVVASKVSKKKIDATLTRASFNTKAANKLKSKGKTKAKNGTEKKRNTDEDETLKVAVFALGGDEEDLELIKGIDELNAEEDEAKEMSEKGDASFSTQARKELEAFIKNLGLDQKFKEVLTDADEDIAEEFTTSDEDDEVESPPPTSANQKKVQVEEVSSTTLDTEVEDESTGLQRQPEFHFLKQKPERKNCIIKSGQKWHEIFPDVEMEYQTSDYWVTKLEKYATVALSLEVENFRLQRQKGSKKSEMAYINTVLKSGALNDKISAYTVLLQESPVQNLQALEMLLTMVSLKSRRPCMMALDSLKDLFAKDLLAPDRKLKQFNEHSFHKLQQLSGGNKDTRDRYLILWLFEHNLKQLYNRFLIAIDEVAKDTIEKTKIKAMSTVLELLISNPENEQELLSRLVNKLGDPVRSVAAKAMYQLGRLLEEHPAMKMVVLKEVERVLYRPNVNKKAQYYGICFLSQILLEEDNEGEQVLANRLIQIYFSFFKANVKQGDIDSKLMSALLTGVNRAFPYAKMAKDKLDDQIGVMFRLVQLCSFNTSVQALMLLYQIMDSGETATDRFYSALYRKLSSPDLATSSKQTMFLNLLFKAIKKDSVTSRVVAFMKRLLQTCQFLPPALVCGILFLISEVIRFRSDLQSLPHLLQLSGKYGTDLSKFDDDSDEEHYDDVKEEVKAEIKSEVEKVDFNEEAEEVKSEYESSEDKIDVNEESVTKETAGSSSWLHKDNFKRVKSCRKLDNYDPYHRNPTFCGAESSILYELVTLSSHFHPSVALFAQNLINCTSIKYPGDPLQDFTLIRFLDRFVFRNPKKDPLKGKPTTVLSKRKLYQPKGVKALAPDSKEYIDREEASVPRDEMFIFRYFRDKKAKATEAQDSDADSVTSEDFNALMDKLSGTKQENADIDFADNVGNMKDFNSEDEDIDVDIDDEEPDLDISGDDSDLSLEDINDMNSDEDEFDEEGFEVSDDQEKEAKSNKRKPGEINDFAPTGKKSKQLKKVRSGDLHSLLASAEEFADLVDESAADDLDIGGSGAMSNIKDKATKKQIKWETKRHQKMEGKGWMAKKGKGFAGRNNRK